MNKQIQNSPKRVNPTNIIFIICFAAITIFALSFVLSTTACKKHSINDISEVTIDDYDKKDHDEYFVYVYATNAVKNDWNNSIVVEYANFAKRHKDVKPIYVLDYNKEGNDSIESKIDSSFDLNDDLPCILVVKEGKVQTTKYKTWSDINNTLTKEMGK